MAAKKSALKKKVLKKKPSLAPKVIKKKDEGEEEQSTDVASTPASASPEPTTSTPAVPSSASETPASTPSSEVTPVQEATTETPDVPTTAETTTDASVLSATPTNDTTPSATQEAPAVVSPAVTVPAVTPVPQVATQPGGTDSVLPTPSVADSDAQTQSHTKTVLRILFIIIFLFLLIGTGFFFMQRFQKGGKQPVAVVSVPTQPPTPTVVTVKLSEFKISVLNGSGISGQASKTKDTLTTAGFSVASTGNATRSVTQTVIAAKKAVSPDFLKKLIATLNTSYQVASDTAVLAEETKDVDVIVTVSKPTQ